MSPACSGAFDNLGFVAGRDAVAIDAATLSNGPTATGTRAGEIFGASVALTVDGLVNNAGALEAANGLTIASANLTSRTACRERRRRPDRIGSRHQQRLDPDRRIMTLTAGACAGPGGIAPDLESRDGHDEGFFENAGTVLGSDTLALTAGTVVNRGDASVIGGKVASVTSNGALTNEGEVTSIDALALEVHGSITNDGRIVATEGSVVLNADGTVSNSRDLIMSGALTLTAAALSNGAAAVSAATPRPSASAAIWTMQASSTRRVFSM